MLNDNHCPSHQSPTKPLYATPFNTFADNGPWGQAGLPPLSAGHHGIGNSPMMDPTFPFDAYANSTATSRSGSPGYWPSSFKFPPPSDHSNIVSGLKSEISSLEMEVSVQRRYIIVMEEQHREIVHQLRYTILTFQSQAQNFQYLYEAEKERLSAATAELKQAQDRTKTAEDSRQELQEGLSRTLQLMKLLESRLLGTQTTVVASDDDVQSPQPEESAVPTLATIPEEPDEREEMNALDE